MSSEIKYLFRFLKPYLRHEMLLLLLIVLSTGAGMASPYFLKVIIDEIIPSSNYQALINILLLLAGIYIVRFFISFSSDYLNTWLENKIMGGIKTSLFNNLVRMPFRYFETNKPGDIIQKVGHEADKIQYFLSTSIIRFLNNMFTVGFLIAMLCWLDYRLFLLTICVIPFSIIINQRTARKLKPLVQETSRREGDLFGFYYDRVKNIRLIKNFDAYRQESDDIQSRLGHIYGLRQKTTVTSSLSRNLVVFVVSLGPLIVFAYGGYQVMQGLMSVGALVAYIQYMNRIYGPSNDLSGLYIEYVRARESARRIYPILSFTPDEQQRTEWNEQVNSISINNLSFSYDGRNNVLNGLGVELHRGKKYVVTGLNGCGKTTLMKFLCQLYQPSPGTIIINGRDDLSQIAHSAWTRKITAISQESSVLYDSIRHNLKYGDPAASDVQLAESLAAVKLSEFMTSLPKQLDTQIGDGDESVVPSGGQTQLIGLARLFLRSRDVIILDEVTASVDAGKEIELVHRIFEHAGDAIIIAISHKLNSIMEYDEVLHMSNGQIIEHGDPRILFASEGEFYKLFKSQAQPAAMAV